MYSSSILYFEREGRENLSQVLRVVKRAFTKREDLRSSKIVIFTAIGQGAALAYNLLQEFEPEIIAVTFPLDFSVKIDDKRVFPRIPDKLMDFFNGVKIRVITGRLPFEEIDGVDGHNSQMKLIKDVLTLFGGSFPQCIQSVLMACDAGAVDHGEKVVAITGDLACLITASSTRHFLSREAGLSVNEILCKPRGFNIARGELKKAAEKSAELFSQTQWNDKTQKKLLIPPKQVGEILEPKEKKRT